MSEVKSVKETVELLEGIKLLAIDVKKVMADGKVDFADVAVLRDLVSQFGALGDAFQGIDQIDDEIKDLSAEELKTLAAKALEIYAAFKAA